MRPLDKMNVNPGGKQRILRDTWWNGKLQKMTFWIGGPKGLHTVLEERGMNANQMRKILGSHCDFKEEKSRVERFLLEKKHIVYMLPNFHPELSLGPGKRYTKDIHFLLYDQTSIQHWIPFHLKTSKTTLEKSVTTCLLIWRVLTLDLFLSQQKSNAKSQ